ncbi:sensor histidine kinase [Novosphingobium bradum]|uniref:histidine kinase n=1 Tax=Novosphingobium bradum TaxID=1737444 RepID=A0ABV7ITC1_9SPHN
MTRRPSPPWSGMALAATGAIGLLLAGTGWWLSLAVLVLWLGSLWLVRPEPEPATVRVDTVELREEARQASIEPIGVPLVILSGERITNANRAARALLGGHILGQDARIALRHPEALRLLAMADGESLTIAGFVRARSLWQLTRRQIDGDTWLIEMADRTAEADVSRAHTDFVANASHELRTPLAAIIGYVETLAEDGPAVDKPTRQKFLQTVLREARRMEALVTDLMSLSQIEAEKHEAPIEPVDLSGLVRQVAGELAALAGKERIVMTVPADPVPLPGDRAQLEQLVRNLIDNALKYGDPGEPVIVELGDDTAAGIVLRVTDRGPGIAPQHLPHLTRRFYRADPGRSRASGGTGLGLAIVKHIVERHRGRLDIASKLGQGTTVSVNFRKVGSVS